MNVYKFVFPPRNIAAIHPNHKTKEVRSCAMTMAEGTADCNFAFRVQTALVVGFEIRVLV